MKSAGIAKPYQRPLSAKPKQNAEIFISLGTERELHILSLEEYVGVLLWIAPWQRRITTSHNALPCTWL
jgi:hypothetical protein